MADSPAATLEPIACSGCGAALALVDEPTAKCPQCGAVTPVPELHRTALREEQRAAELRRSSDVHALGSMPSLPLRILGDAFATNLRLVLGAMLVMFAVGVLTVLGVVVYELIAHVDVFMTVRDDARDRFGIPLWFGMVMLTVGIGVYGQRRAVSLRGVQAALAARPPARPGGPAVCRHCGGPLSVPADAVDVRCIYCATDNLVALPAAWVTGLATATQTAARELAQAQRDFAARTAKLRRRMVISLGFYALFLGGIFGLAAWRSHVDGPSADFAEQPKWWQHVAEPRDLVRRRASGAADQWSAGFAPVTFATACADAPTPLPLESRDCDPTGCTLWLYAALDGGEHASLALTGLAGDASIEVQAPHLFAGWAATPSGRFGFAAGSGTLHAGQPFAFDAGWRTWYQLAIRVAGAAPTTPLGACFSVR